MIFAALLVIVFLTLYFRPRYPRHRNSWWKRLRSNREYDNGQYGSWDNEYTEPNNEQIDYTNCYQPKYLLTKNEWYAFKKLSVVAANKNLIICPKVRLFDLVEPRQGITFYKGAMWKIQSKHVDFVICDKDAHVKGIIELDDSSHNRSDRADRDIFVDKVLLNCGYKVIRTRYIDETILDEL